MVRISAATPPPRQNETGVTTPPVSLDAERVLSSREEGEAHLAAMCFPYRPAGLIGVEIEYTVHDVNRPGAPLDPDRLANALGAHTPTTLRPDSPAAPLPEGSVLTLEPGCQVEISTTAEPSLHDLARVADGDLAYLVDLLAASGLRLGTTGIDAFRSPTRHLRTERYAAMQRRFAHFGSAGLRMMCSTAALQVCLDIGEEAEAATRWTAAHALGPVLVALFANSRWHARRDTRLASARWQAVMHTEPARTWPDVPGPDPAAQWANRVMETPVMVLPRTSGPWDAPARMTFAEWIACRGPVAELPPPTVADLEYHTSGLFTPVRPRGYLEIRYLDAQPVNSWLDPVALITVLLHDESTMETVVRLCEPVAGRWETAARDGLSDPGLRTAARSIVDLGCTRLPETGLPESRVADIARSIRRRLG